MPSSRAVEAMRACISARGTARFSMPKAISPVVSRLKNCVRGFWNTLPTRSATSHCERLWSGAPPTRTSPRRSPS